MEHRDHSRLTGVIFVIGAVFGLVISIGGLIVLWSTRAEVTRQITSTAHLFGEALIATQDMIEVVSTTLDKAEADLDSVHQIIQDVSGSLDQSSGLISSTGDLIGNNMVDFVSNTQTSLSSVENSAKAVDSILTKITAIPLIGAYLGNGYRPDLPLQESVAKVNQSMDPLPDSLKKIRRDLDVSSANVATVQAEIAALATQVEDIQTSIKDARQVVVEYQRILSTVQARYDTFEKRLPVRIDTVYFGLTAVLIWMFITQLGMLLHGIELMG
jgi:methyl-accepting chemotaxis protein